MTKTYDIEVTPVVHIEDPYGEVDRAFALCDDRIVPDRLTSDSDEATCPACRRAYVAGKADPPRPYEPKSSGAYMKLAEDALDNADRFGEFRSSFYFARAQAYATLANAAAIRESGEER